MAIFFAVILNKLPSKIVLVNLNLWFIRSYKKSQCYLHCQHPNIKFISKVEEKSSLSFLDIKIRRISNSFSTSIYRKVTFSKVFTNFESFILAPYKSDLIFTLIFRAFNPNKAGLFEGIFLGGFNLNLPQFVTLVTFVTKNFWIIFSDMKRYMLLHLKRN